ncbi:MAG: hypothetical protein M1831_004188, partial [Alyxoria varia]
CGSSSLLLNPAGFGGCCPTGRWKCFSPDAYYADPVEKPPEEVGNTNLKEGLKAHGCKEFEYEGGSEGSGE